MTFLAVGTEPLEPLGVPGYQAHLLTANKPCYAHGILVVAAAQLAFSIFSAVFAEIVFGLTVAEITFVVPDHHSVCAERHQIVSRAMGTLPPPPGASIT